MEEKKPTPTEALNALHNFTMMFAVRNRLIADFLKWNKDDEAARDILKKYNEAEDLLVEMGGIALRAAELMDEAMKSVKHAKSGEEK